MERLPIMNAAILQLIIGFLLISTTDGQTLCGPRTGTDNNIQVEIYESTFSDSPQFRTNPKYFADLGLYGSLDEPDRLVTIRLRATSGIEYNPATHFEVIDKDPKGTGQFEMYLQLTAPIDRDGATADITDDTGTLRFEVLCSVGGGPTSIIPVVVNIQDENDNSPVFIGTPYSARVSEATPISTTVFTDLSTVDKDTGSNRNIEYSVGTTAGTGAPNPADYFGMDDFSTGAIVVKKPLDYEELLRIGITHYDLQIIASDRNPTSPRSTQSVIRMNITDSDDLGPMFSYPTCDLSLGSANQMVCFNARYRASIQSGSLNTLVFYSVPAANPDVPINIIAADRDTLNSVLEYSIHKTVPSGHESKFSVTTVKEGTKNYRAVITQTGALNRLATPTLDVILKVQEKTTNQYTNRATIRFEVTPVNQFPPTIQSSLPDKSFVGYIDENARVGTCATDLSSNLLRLLVVDNDYAITDVKPNYVFTLDGGSIFTVGDGGAVCLKLAQLDFEKKRQYIFPVTVTDPDVATLNSATASVTINVNNVNDNDPKITGGTFLTTTIPEGTYPGGQFLLKVAATDDDVNDFNIVRFALVSFNPTNRATFTVLPDGTINLVGTATAGEVYTVVFRAFDDGNPARDTRGVLEVTVQKTQNSPPVIPSDNYTVYVSEGVPIDSSVFQIPVRDLEGDTLTYGFSDADTPTLPMTNYDLRLETLNSVATIKNRNRLDRETRDRYRVRVTVSDPAGGSDSTIVTVIVTDVNDNNPRFPVNSYTFSTSETSPINTLLGTIAATDLDLNKVIQYSLDTTDFVVDSSTGQLKSNIRFDYETKNRYTFRATASDTDPDTRKTEIPVTVIITDVADSIPIFVESIYEKQVPENQVGFSVVTVKAVDADSPALQRVVYQFHSSNAVDIAENFNINPSTGEITTRKGLDYETKNFYEFRVTTSDGATSNLMSATALVRVTVTDANDFTPVMVLPSAEIEVPETRATGSLIYDVDANDQDTAGPNSEIRFRIVTVSPNAGTNFFYIHPENGRLLVNAPLTNLVGDSFQINIEAFDRGIPSKSSTGSVRVKIIRNGAPVFTSPNTATKKKKVPTATLR